jgi:hypothetical protein
MAHTSHQKLLLLLALLPLLSTVSVPYKFAICAPSVCALLDSTAVAISAKLTQQQV